MRLLTKLDLFSLLILSTAALALIAFSALILHNLMYDAKRQLLSQQLANLYTRTHVELHQYTSLPAFQPALSYRLQQRLTQQTQAHQQFFIISAQAPHPNLFSQLQFKPEFVEQDFFKHMLGHLAGEINYTWQEQAYFSVYTHLKLFEKQWLLILSLPKQEMIAPWQTYLQSMSMLVLGILGIWLLLQVHMNKLVFSRIAQLLACLKAVEQGDLSRRVAIDKFPTHDEISSLQQRINLTVEALEKRQNDYLQTKLQLETENQERQGAEQALRQHLTELQHTQIEKQHSLQALQREKNHMQALLASIQAGILFEDMSHKVTYCNQAYQTFWCLTEESLLGKSMQMVVKILSTQLADSTACHEFFLSVTQTTTSGYGVVFKLRADSDSNQLPCI